jgi:excisionase family DNA binding protein
MTDTTDRLRGLSDAARTWGIGRSTLSDMLRRGEIAYVRLPGGERRIPDSAVREWIARASVRKDAA